MSIPSPTLFVVKPGRNQLRTRQDLLQIAKEWAFVKPARYAHVDQSYKGAEQVLQNDLPDDAEELAKNHGGIINV